MTSEHQPRFFGDLVNFVAEKARAEHASFTTYISTENMLSNFGGVTTAATLPGSGSVTRFKTGDTLFSNIRTYFKKVWQAEFDGHCSNDVLVFRPKDATVLCSNYLHYLCRWEKFTEFSTRTSKGAKMPRGDKDALAQFQFELPPIEEQHTIAEVLRRHDDKIDLNRRINQTIEAMAQVIFKSWFVDFDPVKAKVAAIAEGRDPLRAAMSAISGKPAAELDALPPEQYNPLAATATLFPDEMEETELGDIPRGWACGALGDICTFTAGSAFAPEHQGSTEGDYPFIKVSDMNLAGNEVFIQSANNYVSKAQQSEMKAKLHPLGATVFAKIGVALISNRRRLLTSPTIIDNNLMSARPVEGKSGQYFLYSLLSTLDFNTLVSGTALPYINVSDLKKIPIVCPPYDACCAFEAKAASMFSIMQTLAAQSSNLATTRDALLPKLLSGEIEASGTFEG